MNVCIKGIAHAVPPNVLTNDDLRREYPEWDMDRTAKRTGVYRRCIAGPDQTSLDLGVEACRKLFHGNDGCREAVDAIIFCTETPDHILPPNACILHGRLDLPNHVLAFDVGLGCSGYPYCLGLARAMLISGMAGNVLLVNAETYSKHIHQGDRASRVLFGDGAAASWIAASDGSGGIVDVEYGTAGKQYQRLIIPAGGCRRGDPQANQTSPTDESRNDKPPHAIQMDGRGILAFTNSMIPGHVRAFLRRNGLAVEDVDLFVFHQASLMVLESLARLLKLKPGQTYSNLADVGNTVSASIPMALEDALNADRISSGDIVVLCGFGLGLSWGSVLLRWV